MTFACRARRLRALTNSNISVSTAAVRVSGTGGRATHVGQECHLRLTPFVRHIPIKLGIDASGWGADTYIL